MAEKKKPEIRFKGFNDDWKQHELGEVVGVYDGVHQTPDYKGSGIMFLSVENITTLKSEKFISEEAFERDYKVYPQKGDILMTRIGDVGTPNVVETAEKVAFYVSLALLKPSKVDSYFLCNSIQSPSFQKSLKNRTLVTAIPQKINKDEIGKIGLVLSTSRKEQQQIGAYFKQIDSLITLHQRKYGKLQNLKKAMLEKMFPRDGADVPEIRFKGFTDAWEKRKVGDLTNVASAARVHKEEWASSGIPFFRSSDVVSAYKGTENEKVFISRELYEHLAKASGKLEKNDILITGGGSIGIPYIVTNNEPLYSKDADLIWVKNSEKFNSQYLYTYFISPEFRKYLSSISHIGTIAHYTIEQVKETPICLPSIHEQNMIGSYFTQLNNLITLQQRELGKLQNIKKTLLDKMFV